MVCRRDRIGFDCPFGGCPPYCVEKVYIIRGQKVMLDRDLAALYGVKTKRLNEVVKRNMKRFEGDDFMFRLTKDEADYARSRSQIATLNSDTQRGYGEWKDY